MTYLSATLRDSAHFELKQAYGRFVAVSLMLALVIHAVAWLFAPPRVPAPLVLDPHPAGPIVVVPDWIEIPPAPQIARPSPTDNEAFDEIVDDLPMPPLAPIRRDVFAPPALPTPTDNGQPAVDFVRHPEVLPTILHSVKPEYPSLARMAEAEGKIIVEASIGVDGRVLDVRIAQSDAIRSLEMAAMAAVRQWLFSPGKQGGEPVPVKVHIPIEFALR